MAKYNKELADNDKVEFIHYSLDRDEDSALGWAKKENFPWLHVLPDDGKKSDLKKFHTSGSVPFYVMIDGEGKVITKGSHSVFAKAKELK